MYFLFIAFTILSLNASSLVLSPNDASALINRIFPDDKLVNAPSPSEMFYKFTSEGYHIYLTKDGKFISEELLPVPNELMSVSEINYHPKLINFIKNKDVIYFRAKNEKNILFSFVDTTCPICQKFIRNMDVLLENNISIKFLALPNTGRTSLATSNMSRMWCNNEDSKLFRKSFTKIVKGLPCKDGMNLIFKQKKLAIKLGATGTPFFITPKRAFSGFYGNKDLINDFK